MWKKNFFIGLIMIPLLGVGFYATCDSNVPFLNYILVWTLIGATYMGTSLIINAILDKLLPWENNLSKRLKWNIATYFVAMLIVSFFISYLETTSFGIDQTLKEYALSKLGKFKTFVYFFTAMFFTFFFHAKGFYEALMESMLKEKELTEARNKSEIQLLQNQLNPHFLFNNLSVLNSLIDENPDTAKEFIHHITNNYRDILNAQQKEFHSVEEEMKIAENYFNLLKIRIGNAIALDIPNTLPIASELLPLSIQMGIENAVKHNITTEEQPLNIKIYPEENYIIVENNFQPKKALHSNKQGLENLRQRYQLHQKNLQTEQTNNAFKMKIPLL